MKQEKVLFKIQSQKADHFLLVIETKLKLFEIYVLLIFYSGCEVWGFQNLDHIQDCSEVCEETFKSEKKRIECDSELGELEFCFYICYCVLGFWRRLRGNKNDQNFYINEKKQ